MDWALRLSRNCVSIHSRCGSQTESVGFLGAAGAGGQGGCTATTSVATVTLLGPPVVRWICELMVLRDTPVARAISRRLAPLFKSVSIVIRKSFFNMAHLVFW